MKKLLTILEQHGILTTRRTPKERTKNYSIAIHKQIQQYIKNGSKDDLFLYKLPITTLPNNLKNVGNNLTLAYTPIKSLPDNLNVNGSLHLAYTQIASLPNNLNVGSELYLYGTPISKKYTAARLKQLLPGVKGKIFT